MNPNTHPFIFASLIDEKVNKQTKQTNGMNGKYCEMSTYVKHDGTDLFSASDAWLNVHGYKTETFELAPSDFISTSIAIS